LIPFGFLRLKELKIEKEEERMKRGKEKRRGNR